MPPPRRRPQSAGPARPKAKPSWDGTSSDLSAMKLSRDDLRMKLESRHHKPLSEYKGGVNIVTKVRPDGTEYKVGANLSLPKPSISSTSPPAAANASNMEGDRARAKASAARGAEKENAPYGGGEPEPGARAASPFAPPPAFSGGGIAAQPAVDYYSGSAAIRAIADEALRALRIPAVSTTTAPAREDESGDVEVPAGHALAPSWMPPPPPLAPTGHVLSAQDWLSAFPLPSSAPSSAPPPAPKPAPALGRAVRQPPPPAARRAPAPQAAVDHRDAAEQASLSEVCEALRCALVKYEHATGRAERGGLLRRPVPQGYTEFLLKSSARLFEYLQEAHAAHEETRRELKEARGAADGALETALVLREELETLRREGAERASAMEERMDARLKAAEDGGRRVAKQVSSLEASLEHRSVTALLDAALPPPAAPAPALPRARAPEPRAQAPAAAPPRAHLHHPAGVGGREPASAPAPVSNPAPALAGGQGARDGPLSPVRESPFEGLSHSTAHAGPPAPGGGFGGDRAAVSVSVAHGAGAKGRQDAGAAQGWRLAPGRLAPVPGGFVEGV